VLALRAETGRREGAAPSRWLTALALGALVGNAVLAIRLMNGEAERFAGPERALLYAPVFAAALLAACARSRGDGPSRGGDGVREAGRPAPT
jgi:hypothetical protein